MRRPIALIPIVAMLIVLVAPAAAQDYPSRPIRILVSSGASYQRTRTWCATGTAKRVRTSGVVTVTDPKAEEKKR